MVWDTLNNDGNELYTFCDKMADVLDPEQLRLLVAKSQDKILMALEEQVSEASAALLKTKKAIVKHEKKFKLENSAVFNSPIPIGHVDLVSPEQSEDSQSFGKKTPVQTTPGSKTAAATPGSVASDEPAEDEMRRTHNIPKDNYPFPGDFIEATDPRPVQTQGPLRSRYRSIWVQGSHVLQKQWHLSDQARWHVEITPQHAPGRL